MLSFRLGVIPLVSGRSLVCLLGAMMVPIEDGLMSLCYFVDQTTQL